MTARAGSVIAERLGIVQQRIVTAGGDLDRIRIVAVSKTRSSEEAAAAVALGLSDLGENYAQELVTKSTAVPGARWHMIGGLQRNKVKRLAPVVSLWQTVDRADLGDEIAKRAPGASILVQVNTSGEQAKSGCAPEAAPALVEYCQAAGLVVEGMMTVGPTSADADPRPGFAQLRNLVDRLGLSICSMGMSRDLEVAVAEGSTMVRVGTALFGPRS